MVAQHNRLAAVRRDFAPALVIGFGAAAAVWIAWFITHLPWLNLRERDALIAIVAVWLIALVALLVRFRVTRLRIAGFSGLIATLPGLLLIGTKIAAPANATAANSGVVPAAPLLVLGFLVSGGVLGLIAGLIAQLLTAKRSPDERPDAPWLARFALVTCVTVAPLLLVGGLVTSTNSGLAVPDWPNTFGSNMFLYPLGPRAARAVGGDYAKVFLEHSHRLFGTLVGLTTLVFAIWTMRRDDRGWVKALVAGAFLLVCVQGLLGGLRVTETSRAFALVHGFLAHMIFGLLIAAAVVLSPGFRDTRALGTPPDATRVRRLKLISTALLHAMIVQILLGAAYRQMRSDHVLYTHIAISLGVMVFAIMAGVSFGAIAPNAGLFQRTFTRLGVWILGAVVVQFLLGWYAFLLGGGSFQAESASQIIPRTLHQANGAFLFALTAAAFVWSRRLCRIATAAVPATLAVAYAP